MEYLYKSAHVPIVYYVTSRECHAMFPAFHVSTVSSQYKANMARSRGYRFTDARLHRHRRRRRFAKLTNIARHVSRS